MKKSKNLENAKISKHLFDYNKLISSATLTAPTPTRSITLNVVDDADKPAEGGKVAVGYIATFFGVIVAAHK